MKAESTLTVKLRVTVGAHEGHDQPALAAARGEGGFTADVAFEVPAGITILFGVSGAGKSTTVSAIAGLIRPDRGRIAIGDEVWFDSERGINRPVHERGVAHVFQSLALFPHMTALKNVEYGIDRRVPRSERAARALAMLERLKVGHVAVRRPHTFSGGEAQRVALARAFARCPSVVLLDEPFSALDRDLRRELCADLRREIDRLRVPAIMITHHRGEARAMGDRMVLLEEGRVSAAGSVPEMLATLEARGSRPSAMDFAETPLGTNREVDGGEADPAGRADFAIRSGS